MIDFNFHSYKLAVRSSSEAYCRDRGRDCFFGTNEHGKPVAVFDAKTNEEFVAKIKHERFLQEKKYEKQGHEIEKKRT